MNYNTLIEMAQEQGKDETFIDLLKNKPLYPIEFTDHNTGEFGKKIEFTGNTSETGIKQNGLGYVLGIARHNPNVGRETGWMEILFLDGTVYGLFFDDINFYCL